VSAPDVIDDEEFCPDCRAGTTSSEHYEKCGLDGNADLSDYIPYEGKTIREIIDDYVLVRGDLVDRDYPHAREQLTSVIENRIRRAVTARVEAVISALDDASRFGYLEESNPGGEEPIRNHGYFIEVDDLTRIARETTS
jgi:hypothetical protein